jgi:hypothetical protein
MRDTVALNTTRPMTNEGASREENGSVLEEHWAVRALPEAERRTAVGDAVEHWTQRSNHDQPLAAQSITRIASLATAYDLAVTEAVSLIDDPSTLHQLAQRLRDPTWRVFQLRAAVDDGTHPYVAIQLAAIAVVAGRTEDYRAWLTARGEESIPPPPKPPEGATRRSRTADLVLDLQRDVAWLWRRLLLVRSRNDLLDVEADIASLRETIGPQGPFALMSARILLYAAGDLTTYLLHGEPISVLGNLMQQLQAARAAAPGDTALRAAASWLLLACACRVEGTEQLPLADLVRS